MTLQELKALCEDQEWKGFEREWARRAIGASVALTALPELIRRLELAEEALSVGRDEDEFDCRARLIVAEELRKDLP